MRLWPIVMQMVIDEPAELAEWLQGIADHLIAFDGYQGAGKSSVVQAMAKFLDIPACHLDDFVKPKQGSYFNSNFMATAIPESPEPPTKI